MELLPFANSSTGACAGWTGPTSHRSAWQSTPPISGAFGQASEVSRLKQAEHRSTWTMAPVIRRLCRFARHAPGSPASSSTTGLRQGRQQSRCPALGQAGMATMCAPNGRLRCAGVRHVPSRYCSSCGRPRRSRGLQWNVGRDRRMHSQAPCSRRPYAINAGVPRRRPGPGSGGTARRPLLPLSSAAGGRP